MTENRRIVLNFAATYGRSMYSMLTGLFTSRWVLMALGEVDYGLYGVICGLTAFISFITGVMGESLVRFYAYSIGEARVSENSAAGLERCRKWFSIAVAIHLALPLVLVAIGYPCGVWAVRNWLVIPPDRVETCVWVWRIVCFSCFFGMASVPFGAMYTAKQEIAELTVYSFIGRTVYTLLVYAAVSLPGRDWFIYYAVMQCALGIVPQLVINVRAVYKYRECRFRWSLLKDLSAFADLFKYVGLRFFGLLSQLFTTQGLALSVNKMLGPARNAAMTLGMGLAANAQSLTLSLKGAMQPAITSATGAGDDARANSLTLRTCLFATLGLWIFAAPLFVEADEVMILWLKNPPSGSALLCKAMLVAMLVDSLTVGTYMRIFATGRIAAFQIGECIVWISALFIAVAWFAMGGDVVGAGIGYAVMYAMNNVLKLYCVRRVGGPPLRAWFGKVLAPCAVVAAGTVAVGFIPGLFMERSFSRLVATTALCEAALFVLAWFAAFGEAERRFVLSKLRRAFGRGA